MTVVLEDVHATLQLGTPSDVIKDLLYADDTLLVGSSTQEIEKKLSCIVAMGAQYGLTMNWKKVELMSFRADNGVQRQRKKRRTGN